MTQARCPPHQAPAGWRCTECERFLCPDCAAEKVVHPATVVVCLHCGGLARTLTVHRREVETFAHRVPGALRWPFSGEGLLAWLGVVMLATVFGSSGVMLWGPGAIAACFAVVRSTARGQEHMDTPDFGGLLDLAWTVVRFLVCMLPFWVPVLAYGLVADHPRTGVLWTLGLVGAAFVPQAFLMAAVDSPLLALINPLTVVGTAVRLGPAYPVYAATSAGLLVLGALLTVVGLVLGALPLPFFSRALEAACVLYAPFVIARVAGLLLYVEGDRLEYDVPERFREPVLGSVAPRGVPHIVERAPEAPPRSFEPIAIEGDEPADTGTARDAAHLRAADAPALPHHAVELPPLPVPGATPADTGDGAGRAAIRVLDVAKLPALAVAAPDQDHDSAASTGRTLDLAALPDLSARQVEELRVMMRQGDAAGALNLWREVPGLALTPAELGWLGRAAASLQDDPAAARLFEAAAQRAAPGPERAQALVVLARFQAERLRSPLARATMERVLRESPDEATAAWARQWLARGGA